MKDNYYIPEEEMKNLLIFLNRVEYKGLGEVQAINNIINCLNHPVENKSELSPSDE